jgi:hypothetical protein
MKARLSEGYKPQWDVDLRYGQKGEAFVAEYLNGLVNQEGRLRVEVKSDRLMVETGNVWIEVECRRRDGWHDSGIRTTEADMWGLVLAETVIVGVPTAVLRVIAERAWDETESRGKHMFRSEEKDGSHPTRGVRLPLALFIMRLRTELRRQAKAA